MDDFNMIRMWVTIMYYACWGVTLCGLLVCVLWVWKNKIGSKAPPKVTMLDHTVGDHNEEVSCGPEAAQGLSYTF